MTSARIVTPGQAMATIPTTTARMPSRINEVDDDLNMTGHSFRFSHTTSPGKSVVRVLVSRHDGRRLGPTSTAYRGIAPGYATACCCGRRQRVGVPRGGSRPSWAQTVRRSDINHV